MAKSAPPAASERGDEPRIGYVVARLDRSIRQAIGERLKPYRLTTLQYTTLSVLGRRGGLSNAQLARRAYMTPQAMNEVLEALEAKGFIVRSSHPAHRRVFPAALTDEGRRVLRAADELVDDLERSMLAGRTTGQITSFRAAMIAAVRALQAGFPDI